MQIITLKDINKTYGVDNIIDDVSFGIEENMIYGIIGNNGAGKSTLLKIITGEISPSKGSVFIKNDYKIGYLKQEGIFKNGSTILEACYAGIERFTKMEESIERYQKEISNAGDRACKKEIDEYTKLLEKFKEEGGYYYKSEIKAVMSNMGFGEEVYNKKVELLSGGERTRLSLAILLLQKPDILILDEPTNHLDFRMLNWLEDYLKKYRGTILIVSHDRYFLNKLSNRIIEVKNHGVKIFDGNYSDYLIKSAAEIKSAQKQYEKQKKEIEKQEEIIRRFKAHNTEKLVKRAKSREKKLEQMTLLEKPNENKKELRFKIKSLSKSGNDVLICDNIEKSFGKKKILDSVSFEVKKGERVCIVGENGIGKTTLLKVILGMENPDAGYLKIGHNVDFGYYDQGQLLLDPNETPLSEVRNKYHLYDDTDIRKLLGRFLFFGDDVFKKISDLSGGEKAKLSILKVILSGANTLILDEPTNHLDLASKEALENALMTFDGTLIMVSHDRFLLQKVPTRILELTKDGIINYQGNYDYYIEKKGNTDYANLKNRGKPEKDSMTKRLEAKEKEKEIRRKKREKQSLEEKINRLELEIKQIEDSMLIEENSKNFEFLHNNGNKIAELKKELDAAYESWIEIEY